MPDEAVQVQPGPFETASIRTADGRWVRLHSSHDPIAEAERLLAFACPDLLPGTLFVVGLGLGYVIDALERRHARPRVIAFEPMPELARALLARRDWHDWLANGQLTLLVGPAYEGSSEVWKRVAVDEHEPAIISHPVLARERAADVAAGRRLAETAAVGARANDRARRLFAGRYLLNTLSNLSAICDEGDAASLTAAIPPMPAVLVAAGPSLDRALPALLRVRSRALIIAVDTALRPLLAAGIRPHLVVAVDPSDTNAQHLLGIPDSQGPFLVTEGSIGEGVYRAFQGRAFTFKVSHHHPWPWLESFGCDRGNLRAWGSVLTTAFDLAATLSCDPITFVGADLAYTDGLLYCRNTIHEKYWTRFTSVPERAAAVRDYLSQRQTCEHPDVRGRAVLTTPTFLQFRNWLASNASDLGRTRRIVNATGGGVLHGEHIHQAEPEDLDYPALGWDIGDLRAQLAAARDATRHARAEARARIGSVLERTGPPDLPFSTWIDFAAGGASADDIIGRLARDWRSAPVVTSQPESVQVVTGWTATFHADASGAPAPQCSWQFRSSAEASWASLRADNDGTCRLTATAEMNGRSVRAVFENPHGQAVSDPATLQAVTARVAGDFSGNGWPDLLWRDGFTGAFVVWYLEGLARQGMEALSLTEPDPLWRVAAIADLDGDGCPDLVWHHAESGFVRAWIMRGIQVHRTMEIGRADRGWVLVGTGDFTGRHGQPDLVWRNHATGNNQLWLLDGMRVIGERLLPADADAGWSICAVDDFDEDGRPDLLWRHASTGANRLWLMDGTTCASVLEVEGEPDPDWLVVATGRFGPEHTMAILWQHATTGKRHAWLMDGGRKTSTVELEAVADPRWSAATVRARVKTGPAALDERRAPGPQAEGQRT